jgi:hypothetical protein
MEKVTTKCGKVVYFGIQTPKGTTYFGDEAAGLTHFMRNKSTDIVSINGKIVTIHSEEHPSPGNFTYYLDDGKTLVIRPVVSAHGSTVSEAFFDRNWK